MKFRPFGDRIAVRVIPAQEIKARGGLVLLEGKMDALQGEVVGVGRGFLLQDGTWKPSGLKEGDVVAFAKFSGSELKLVGKPGEDEFRDVLDLKILRIDEVMGVVEHEDGSPSAAAAKFQEEARTG